MMCHEAERYVNKYVKPIITHVKRFLVQNSKRARIDCTLVTCKHPAQLTQTDIAQFHVHKKGPLGNQKGQATSFIRVPRLQL